MKSVDVKPNTYIDSSKDINDEDPKFKVGDIVRTSKYKNIFAKDYVSNWSEDVFVIKKFRNTVPWRGRNSWNVLRKRIGKKSNRV